VNADLKDLNDSNDFTGVNHYNGKASNRDNRTESQPTINQHQTFILTRVWYQNNHSHNSKPLHLI